MNKRDFMVGSVGSVGLASTTLAAQAAVPSAPILGRLQRWPDLASQPGAEQFERYVGEAFDTPAGRLTLSRVETRALDEQLEQFVLHFDGTATLGDGVHLLRHTSTGQTMHTALQASADGGWRAHFCQLA
jgi:hypothetical protein